MKNYLFVDLSNFSDKITNYLFVSQMYAKSKLRRYYCNKVNNKKLLFVNKAIYEKLFNCRSLKFLRQNYQFLFRKRTRAREIRQP